MRKNAEKAAYTEGGEPGPLSKIHAAAGSGARNSPAVSRTMVPLWTTALLRGTTFLQTLRRSALMQFGARLRHQHRTHGLNSWVIRC
jgi:hypothetical protein